MPNALLAVILAYLIGSIPFAVVVSRIMRLPDPRTYGSNNPGATNVLRTGNRIAALLTLAGDAAKGWVAVTLFYRFAPQFDIDMAVAAPVALLAFLGHVYPVWLRFRGGKGVATALGVLLALDAWVALITLAVWIAVVALSRYSSLGAIVAAVCVPFVAVFRLGWAPLAWAITAMSLLLLWRHRVNIGKLWRGEESRIGEKRAAEVP